MKRNRLPSLPDTGRHYVERTGRSRLMSPGVERFEGRRRSGGRNLIIALAIAAALLAAMVWLS